MKISVLYFASLREKLGVDSEIVEPPTSVQTVGALRDWLVQRGGQNGKDWAALNAGRIRAALDQMMCAPDAALHDGAEVAFFPPVTGG